MSDVARSYGPTAVDDTLTSKALRVASKAEALREKLSTINERVVAGLPPPNAKAVAERDPSHAMFALEAAERALDDAAGLADSTLRAL